MRKLHVGTSPLSNRIYAGHILKDGATWGEGKQDVTGAACGAVCEHVLANGEPVIVTCNGKPKYEISVREIREPLPEPTNCGYCSFEESDGELIEQCPKCKAADEAKRHNVI